MLPPPSADPSGVVKAAEALLESAREFAAAVEAGNLTKAAEDEMRRKLGGAAQKMAADTLSPPDLTKSEFVGAADVLVTYNLMKWKAFDHIPVGGSISIADLAAAVDADESLVSRLCGFLVGTGKLLPGRLPNHIRHSPMSSMCVSTHPFYSVRAVHAGNAVTPLARWPAYFETYGRSEPPAVTHTPFSFSWGHPELAPWEVKALYPEYATLFAQSMESKSLVGGGMRWTGPEAFCDLGWLDGGKVVDVGGGLGQLLKDVLEDIPSLKAEQCVLQDRKEVIEQAVKQADPALKGAVMMAHDFNQEQPVKGASLYFVRRILLDYPDNMATGILRQLADAMSADKPESRVLIMEDRLSDPPVPMNRLVDLVMLSIGGKLRSRDMMTAVAEAAGLKVVGYHIREPNPMYVMECAKA